MITQQEPQRIRTGTGLYSYYQGNITISGTTISLCDKAVYYYNNNNQLTTSNISNSVITNNKKGIYIDPRGSYKYPNLKVNNSDIYNNLEWNVYIGGGANPSTTEYDMLNNYWGSLDSTLISSQLYDNSDNNTVASINFTPYAENFIAKYGLADINRDGKTDGYDLAILASTFGLSSTNNMFKANADLNHSGRVDGFDLAILGLHFGQFGAGIIPKLNSAYLDSPIKIHVNIEYNSLSEGDIITYVLKSNLPEDIFAFQSKFNIQEGIELIASTGRSVFSEDNSWKMQWSEKNEYLLAFSQHQNCNLAESGQNELLRLEFKLNRSFSSPPTLEFSGFDLIRNDGATTYSSEILYDFDISSKSETEITSYKLFQNYPNPFNPETTVKFMLPSNSHVQFDLFSIQGEKIRTVLDDFFETGQYSFKINAVNLASGTYFLRMKSKNFEQFIKLLLVK